MTWVRSNMCETNEAREKQKDHILNEITFSFSVTLPQIAGSPSHPTPSAGLLLGSSGANLHRDDHPHHRDPPHPTCQTALLERSDG